MPDSSPPASLVIAHQLPPAFAQAFGQALPAGVVLHGLPPDAAWDVPEDAAIFLPVPPRGGNVIVPSEKPAGWPRNLRWIHTASAGIDEYPPWIFDVPLVTCGRGTNSAPIAEYVIAALLAVEKQLDTLFIQDATAWKPRALGTLQGKTLGLLGYGSIAQAIAARAAPFGLRTLATSRTATHGNGLFGAQLAPIETVLEQADHLVITLPLTPLTTNLIDSKALARLKPTAHLVNISRGRILDTAALVEALNAGTLAFATLDVTEPEPLPAGHPLYTHPHVHLSPHISWSGGERGRAGAELFAANLKHFLAGEPLIGIVSAQAGY
jgi:phosphoglycerate dehydrogenase-like enzyme